MIENYQQDSIYHVFQISDLSKKIKIGEILDGKFYDVDKTGKKIGRGTIFVNNFSFWSQFKSIEIKKIERPLGGFESLAWGAYWTISALLSIFLIIVAYDISNQLFWLFLSIIHFLFTIKFRNNKYVLYWMSAASIIVILLIYSVGKKK